MFRFAFRAVETVVFAVADTIGGGVNYAFDGVLKVPNKVVKTTTSTLKKIEKTAVDISYKIDKLIDE